MVMRPFFPPAAGVLGTVAAWHLLGAAWLVPALGAMLLVAGLARRALVLPLLVGWGFSLAAWLACALVPGPALAEGGSGRALLLVDRLPDPPSGTWTSLDATLVLAFDGVRVPAGTRVQLTVPGRAAVAYGEHLLVDARWKPVEFPVLKARGVRYRGAARSRPLALGQATGPLWDVGRALQAARAGLVARVEQVLPESAAALATAITLGTRGSLSPEDRQALAATGLFHLFAISGMNLAILGALLYALFRLALGLAPAARLALADRRWAALATILVTLGYTFLSGASVSTLRAWLMLTLYLLSVWLEREADGLNFLLASAVILLLWSPPTLADPSFQLSFAGVAALFLAGLVVPSGTVRQALAATWFAFLATTPVIYAQFGAAPLGSPLANLPGIPAFSFVVMPTAYGLTVLAWAWPALASWLATPAAWVLDGFAAVVRRAGEWMPSVSDPAWFLLLYAACLLPSVAWAWRAVTRRGGALPPG
jgi:competence protein ComEC